MPTPEQLRQNVAQRKTPTTNENSPLPRRRQMAGLAGQHFGGERDLYETLGYPRRLDVNDYMDIYRRQDIAQRIVDTFPKATWRQPPKIAGEDRFKEAFKELSRKHRLWRSFLRLDRLAGIGHYGVLVLGLDGGEPMYTPARGTDYNLIYVQPHSERTAQIIKWEDNPASPRYGQPLMYRVTSGVNWTGAGAGQKSINVHWTRVIHVAENPQEDVSIGTPRLEAVYNRLMDLDKMLGGGAEIFWQNAAAIYAFIADSGVEWEPEEQKAMASQLEEMQHGLRRSLRLRGVQPEQLAPGMQGADPTALIDKELEFVSGTTTIPKRILLGSEQGELASSQDENNFATRVSERQEQFAGPDIVEQFIAAGTRLGFLPRGFQRLEWEQGDTLGEEKRAAIADKKASALQRYCNTAGTELVVPPNEFRGWIGEEALDDEDQIAEELAQEADEADPEATAQFNRLKAIK